MPSSNRLALQYCTCFACPNQPTLLYRLQTSETRSQLVGRFLEQYQLTPAEAKALQVCCS